MPDIPTDWADLPLDSRILEAVKDLRWGGPTPVQGACIPLALKGKDMAIQSRTGSGKTGAFVIPVIQRIITEREQKGGANQVLNPVALIIVPSLELCEQTLEATEALARHVRPRLVVDNLAAGGVISARRVESAQIVVCTAALLAKFCKSGAVAAECFEHLRYLVIDEADLLVSIAELSLRTIQSVLPNTLQVILSSATLTDGVASLKGQLLHNPVNVVLTTEVVENARGKESANRSRGSSTPIVESRVVLKDPLKKTLRQYYLVATDTCHRHTLLYSLYRLSLIKGKTLIFVDNDEDTYRLQNFLEQMGAATLVYDASLPMNVRLSALRKFQTGTQVTTLVCTDGTLEGAEKLQMSFDGTEEEEGDVDNTSDKAPQRKRRRSSSSKGGCSPNKAAALHRGIDFAQVRNIILFDGVDSLSPIALSRYTHRIGRAARGGQEGLSITFFTVPQAKKYIQPLRHYCKSKGDNLEPFRALQRSEAAKLQYRVDSVLANITRTSIRKLRVATVAAELSRSSYLANHMSEKDTDALRRVVARSARKVRVERSLLAVPDYMHLEGVDEVSDYTKRVRADQTRATTFRKITRTPSVDPLKAVASKLRLDRKRQ